MSACREIWICSLTVQPQTFLRCTVSHKSGDAEDAARAEQPERIDARPHRDAEGDERERVAAPVVPDAEEQQPAARQHEAERHRREAAPERERERRVGVPRVQQAREIARNESPE